MIRRPPRSTLDRSSAASDVYKRQVKVPTRLVLSVIIPSRPVVTMVTTPRIRQKDPPRGGSGDTGPVMRAVFLGALLSLTASASLRAQSLGGVARQEQEKK